MRTGVLRRVPYLTAVTGYPASSAVGEVVVARRLEADAARARTAVEPSGPE